VRFTTILERKPETPSNADGVFSFGSSPQQNGRFLPCHTNYAPMSAQRDTGFQPVQAAPTEENRRFRGHPVRTSAPRLEKRLKSRVMIGADLDPPRRDQN
jgi:hypothetical protein